jgi:hypothetical protein
MMFQVVVSKSINFDHLLIEKETELGLCGSPRGPFVNRLKYLQSSPVLYIRAFYLASPAVFVFFIFAILVSCFGVSLQEIRNYWSIPALIGGAFLLYASYRAVFVQENQNPVRSQQDIETTPDALKEKLYGARLGLVNFNHAATFSGLSRV